MNKTFKLLTALFALVAIAACQKEPDAVAPATIEVETTELSFTERGETLSIDYTIKNAINGTPNTDALLDLYLQHQNEVEGNPEIKALFTARKQQLKLAA